MYVVSVRAANTVFSHCEVFEKLLAFGVGVNLHYIPVYRQPYYVRRYGYRAAEFPVAENYYAEAISIPMYAGLTDDLQVEVVSGLKRLFA